MPADRAPRWVSLTPLGLSIAGLAVSVYLTVEHYTTPVLLACPENSVIDCRKVTSSPESVVLGVPLAVWGLVYFVAMVALTVPAASRWPRLPLIRLAAAAVGAVSVIYLIYLELFVVDAICLWCTAIHVITVALFATLALTAAKA